jgi:hypothetical protein
LALKGKSLDLAGEYVAELEQAKTLEELASVAAIAKVEAPPAVWRYLAPVLADRLARLGVRRGLRLVKKKP